MVDLHGSSANMENLLGIRSKPANTLKETVQCGSHPEDFSKNNKDIGRTTLIEMEIDMGDSLPVAQNPYTLPLKHHKWVRKEIETLEKAGVIV